MAWLSLLVLLPWLLLPSLSLAMLGVCRELLACTVGEARAPRSRQEGDCGGGAPSLPLFPSDTAAPVLLAPVPAPAAAPAPTAAAPVTDTPAFEHTVCKRSCPSLTQSHERTPTSRVPSCTMVLAGTAQRSCAALRSAALRSAALRCVREGGVTPEQRGRLLLYLRSPGKPAGLANFFFLISPPFPFLADHKHVVHTHCFFFPLRHTRTRLPTVCLSI